MVQPTSLPWKSFPWMRAGSILALKKGTKTQLSLQPKQAKAMLKSPCPLKDVYEEFRDRETGYMDTIRESIEAEADRCIHKEKQRASREDR